MKIQILVFLLLQSLSTITIGQGFKILGTIEKPNPETTLSVLHADLENNTWETLAKITISNNGIFQLKSQIGEPGIYDILYEGQYLRLLLPGNDEVKIHIKKAGDKYILETQQSETAQYLQFKNQCDQFGSFKVSALNNLNSSLAVYATSDEWKPESVPEIRKVIAGLFEPGQPDIFSEKIIGKLNRLERIAIGSVMPEIILADVNGTLTSTNKLKGKYVLVDFWASWCGPCRKENPNLVKTFNEFKTDGFTIFGVSLDQDKDKWMNAIKKDSLIWTQVSDLTGWGGELLQIFNIQNIPYNILIDPNGKIIIRDVYGDDLKLLLSEILRKK